jgi:hypothetical protein
VPAFATLPEGHVPELPAAKPPERIPASEKVPELIAEPMPADQARQMMLSGTNRRFTYLFADPERAKAFVKSHGNSGDGSPTACLVDGGDADALKSGRDAQNEDEPRDWPTGCSSMIALQFDAGGPVETAGGKRSGRGRRITNGEEIHAVRSERFVAGQDGRASLEMTDGWFDAHTRGARLIGRTTLPLSRVFVGPNGLEVYAARDGAALHVVLHVSDHPADDAALSEQLLARMRSVSVTMPERNGGNSDSGHLHLMLRAAPGVGQMATLQSTAFLPPADGDWGPVPDGESDSGRGQRMVQAMRQRPFQLGVSATMSSADKSPVMSIALGWTGREQKGG